MRVSGCGNADQGKRDTGVRPPAGGQFEGLGEPAAAEAAWELSRVIEGLLADRIGVSFPQSGYLAPSQWVVAWGPGEVMPEYIPGWLWEKAVAPLLRDAEFWGFARKLVQGGRLREARALILSRIGPLVAEAGRWGTVPE